MVFACAAGRVLGRTSSFPRLRSTAAGWTRESRATQCHVCFLAGPRPSPGWRCGFTRRRKGTRRAVLHAFAWGIECTFTV